MDRGIKITHIPTGIVTTCETARSQHINRVLAMEELRIKLDELD
jgi:peptide chain release factor 2